MGLPYARITGTGLGVPSIVRTNDDLAKLVETSDDWIVTRTGIKERRIVDLANGETQYTIGLAAAKQALERSKLDPKQIDLIVCASTSADTLLPGTACRLVDGLGVGQSTAFDVNAACSGFVAALHIANGLIRAGLHRNVMVVGSEALSSFTDWTDRTTCVLFGDGAGAVVLEAMDNADPKKDPVILASKLYTVFDASENLAIKGGGSRCPSHMPEFNKSIKPYITMNSGAELFKLSTRSMAQAAIDVLAMCGMTIHDIDWFVPHQANLRIIEMVGKILELPSEKVYVNVDKWGNTSAATVAICLAEMEEKKLLKSGDICVLDVFGGGYTYGAVVVRWP